MFLSKIKKVFHKMSLNKEMDRVAEEVSDVKIKTIAVLINATQISDTKIDEITNQFDLYFDNSFQKSFFCYKPKIGKEELVKMTTFTMKDLSIFGSVSSQDLKEYIDTKFDLVIHFFKDEDSSLHLIALRSKGNFKVGFKNEMDLYNHLIIDVDPTDVELFFLELKKYLKILQKIE